VNFLNSFLKLIKLKTLSDFNSLAAKFINIFIIRKLQLLILKFEAKHIHGPKEVDYGLNELVVLCLVRNSQLYINSFIEHYQTLGVKHIFFLDNNSTDNTIPIAQKYKNVTIFQTKLPFKKYKMAMRHYLINNFAKGSRWALFVDIDEFFDYPFSDTISLKMLLTYLNERSYTSVVAYMLDMHSDKPILNQNVGEDRSLDELYKYYDLFNIIKMQYYFPQNILANNEIAIYFGGIRKTLFDVNAFITKHPLFFLDTQIKPLFTGGHDTRYAHIADFTGVLLHYKFTSDFYERTVRAVQEENYADNSANYKKIYNVLKHNPDFQIKQDTSEELNNINELIDRGFLVVSEDYIDWVKAVSKNGVTSENLSKVAVG